jgi:dynein heavy chain 1
LQTINRKAKLFQVQLEEDDNGEKLLQKNRFMFPADWLFMERVRSEWNAFEQILGCKLARMNKDGDKIQKKITEESKKLEQRVAQLCADWKKNRPMGADLDHPTVLDELATYDHKVTTLQDELEGLVLPREALKMPPKEEHRLKSVKEELDSLKSVWDVLGGSWTCLRDIEARSFREIKPKEIRRELSKLQTDVKRLPAELQQYTGHETLKITIKDRLDMNHPCPRCSPASPPCTSPRTATPSWA